MTTNILMVDAIDLKPEFKNLSINEVDIQHIDWHVEPTSVETVLYLDDTQFKIMQSPDLQYRGDSGVKVLPYVGNFHQFIRIRSAVVRNKTEGLPKKAKQV